MLEVRQTFSLRKDKLATRVRYVPEQKTHEIYEPGRPWGLREHIWIEGLRRELHFSCSARLDGLMLRVEEFGKKCVQTYDGSKDNLIYRSVSYRQSGASPADASPETSFSWLKMPSALFGDSAPFASLDCLKARAAPTHPRAPPEPLGSLPGASAARLRPLQRWNFSTFNHQVRPRLQVGGREREAGEDALRASGCGAARGHLH